jgi:hypothetical protein
MCASAYAVSSTAYYSDQKEKICNKEAHNGKYEQLEKVHITATNGQNKEAPESHCSYTSLEAMPA